MIGDGRLTIDDRRWTIGDRLNKEHRKLNQGHLLHSFLIKAPTSNTSMRIQAGEIVPRE